jgi:hypothetical protein
MTGPYVIWHLGAAVPLLLGALIERVETIATMVITEQNEVRLRRSPATLRLLALALASGALLVAGADAALSQVQVSGGPEAVHIEARDVTVREVLDALQANFKLGYRSDDVLDKRMTGTFDGTLRKVTARILDGYDFAIKVSPEGVDILVLRQNNADGAVVANLILARATKSLPRATTAVEANRRLVR